MLLRHGKQKSLNLAWFAAAMAMLLAIVALVWRSRQPSSLAAHWQAELSQAPDEQVNAQLHKIASLGDAGLPVLVASLGSSRQRVREEAQAVLLEQVNQWELSPPATVAPELALLAHALSERSPRWEIPQRRFAADLALRMLMWPGAGLQDRAQPLAECEAVLSAAAADHDDRPTAEPKGTIAAATPEVERVASDWAPLPGGGLPIEIAQIPATSISPETLAVAKTDSPMLAEPGRLPNYVAGRPLIGSEEPEWPGIKPIRRTTAEAPIDAAP